MRLADDDEKATPVKSETPIAEQLRRARTAIAEERLQDALAAIESTLALDPTNEEAMTMAVALGEHDEEARLEKIERTHTRSSVLNSPADDSTLYVHVTQARRLFLEGQFDHALAEITLALLVNPTSHDALSLEKEIQHAIGSREHVGSQSSGAINAILLVARRYVERDKLDRALEEIDAGLQLQPGQSDLLWLRNDVCEKAQLKKEQEARARKNALVLSIREHFARTDFDSAQKEIESALGEFPDDRDIIQLQDQISVSQKKWQQLHQFERQKDEVNLRVRNAHQLIQSERFDEAIAEVALGLLVAPFSPELTSLEKELLRERASHAEDIRDTSAEETQVALHIIAAEEFAKLGEFGKALDEIAQAYLQNPRNSDIKKVEIRIRQLQRPQSVPLKLVYTNEQLRISHA